MKSCRRIIGNPDVSRGTDYCPLNPQIPFCIQDAYCTDLRSQVSGTHVPGPTEISGAMDLLCRSMPPPQ
jgi:hypothetical protein